MKLFISSVVFVFTILNVTTSFAQNPLPAQSNIAQPSSTAGDTVDVQHVIDAYHEAVLTNDGSRSRVSFFLKAACGSTYFLMRLTPVRKRSHRMR